MRENFFIKCMVVKNIRKFIIITVFEKKFTFHLQFCYEYVYLQQIKYGNITSVLPIHIEITITCFILVCIT